MMTRALLGSCLLLAACGGDGGPVATPQPKPVASVTVSPASLSLLVGQSGTLAAEAKDASGAVLSGRTITWSSSDGAIATVSTAGMVTGVAVGTATVSAASEGKTGVATITVSPVPAASVEVTPATATLYPTQSRPFVATVKDSAGGVLSGRTVVWTTSNGAVATISTSGLLSAVAFGSVTVSASVEGKTGTANVSVIPVPVTAIAAGWMHTVALKADGTLWAWGHNVYGQLGNGDIFSRSTPTPVAGGATWTTIAAGAIHTVALMTGGTLWTWGSSMDGQIGDGAKTGRPTPTQIATGTTWRAIAAGTDHTIAVRSDGTLWGWGLNDDGQLGAGTMPGPELAPTQIGTGTTWNTVAAGWKYTIALKSDGTLWAWGMNADGQLGDGTISSRETPTPIAGGATWRAIAAGWTHTIALKSDGTLWAWGKNADGQLGDGTISSRNTPTPIAGGATWSAIAAGANHSLAIRTDGTLWAWGSNTNGEIGDGTVNTLRPTPTQIGIGTTWSAVAGGFHHTIALKSDGTVWVWGENGEGKLGDATTTDRFIPTLIVF